MTVQQLIEELSKVKNKNARVIADGCDCVNPAIGIYVDSKGDIGIRIDSMYQYEDPIDYFEPLEAKYELLRSTTLS